MRNGTQMMSGSSNLVGAAEGAGLFKTYLAAATRAGIIDTLGENGPFTLFAPTDEAFGKFTSSTMAKLMAVGNRALLTTIVAYHLAPGKVMFGRFAGKRYRAKTLEGRELRIDGARAEGGVTVNGVHIVRPDIVASNGVLHGIASVLWPKPVREEG